LLKGSSISEKYSLLIQSSKKKVSNHNTLNTFPLDGKCSGEWFSKKGLPLGHLKSSSFSIQWVALYMTLALVSHVLSVCLAHVYCLLLAWTYIWIRVGNWATCDLFSKFIIDSWVLAMRQWLLLGIFVQKVFETKLNFRYQFVRNQKKMKTLLLYVLFTNF
jgi:hypothetical protein